MPSHTDTTAFAVSSPASLIAGGVLPAECGNPFYSRSAVRSVSGGGGWHRCIAGGRRSIGPRSAPGSTFHQTVHNWRAQRGLTAHNAGSARCPAPSGSGEKDGERAQRPPAGARHSCSNKNSALRAARRFMKGFVSAAAAPGWWVSPAPPVVTGRGRSGQVPPPPPPGAEGWRASGAPQPPAAARHPAQESPGIRVATGRPHSDLRSSD